MLIQCVSAEIPYMAMRQAYRVLTLLLFTL